MRSIKRRLLLIFLLDCGLLASGCAVSPDSKPLNIETPGPDLANYPNSAYTLPEGHSYIEASPVTYNGKTENSPQQYNAGYLMRYGIYDDLELRLISSGFIVQDSKPKDKKGFGPQVFGIKWHLIDDVIDSYIPAIGIEAAVQTNWASAAFKNGTYPAFSLNFDKKLPYEISAELNVGVIGFEDLEAKDVYQLILAWALQRNVTQNLALFINGYSLTATGESTSAIGGGAQWLLNDRLAVFTNISAGLTTDTPSVFSLLGFAVAF